MVSDEGSGTCCNELHITINTTFTENMILFSE